MNRISKLLMSALVVSGLTAGLAQAATPATKAPTKAAQVHGKTAPAHKAADEHQKPVHKK